MKLLILTALLTISFQSPAECVHEKILLGEQILEYPDKEALRIEVDGSFLRFTEVALQNGKSYDVQFLHQNASDPGDFSDYNRRYVQYYDYPRMQAYISELSPALSAHGYQSEVIGKSLQGRNLYGVFPKAIDPSKKTVIVFGRHHGDEGSANWIIEGLANNIFSNPTWHEEFQLLLYPMVNPDGAENRVRYNTRNRDLNRVWDKNPDKSLDEVQVIHRHLSRYLPAVRPSTVIVLDMHGSFVEDFIYRVNQNFLSAQFFAEQGKFIAQVGAYDPWQKGHFILSDGHPKMSRIMLIREYGLNALTHESIRDIPKNKDRSIETLKRQGLALSKAILDLY